LWAPDWSEICNFMSRNIYVCSYADIFMKPCTRDESFKLICEFYGENNFYEECFEELMKFIEKNSKKQINLMILFTKIILSILLS